MTTTAKIRRSPVLRRIFLSTPRRPSAPARTVSARLAHLGGMNESPHPIPGLEPMLTTSELAAHLGVPVQTIHDLRHLGRGPRGIRIGRELRYRLSEIQHWLTELEQGDPLPHRTDETEAGR